MKKNTNNTITSSLPVNFIKADRVHRCAVAIILFICMGFAWAGEAHGKIDSEKRPFLLSPTASWYFPSEGKVKNAFGNSWGGIGVALNMEALGWKKPGLRAGKAVLSPYIGYLHGERRNNDAYIIPIGLESRWDFTDEGTVKPYAGLGVSLCAVKFDDHEAGVKTGWRGAAGGRILLGTDVGKWLNIHASYSLMSDVEDYNFSGFSLGAKITFYF